MVALYITDGRWNTHSWSAASKLSRREKFEIESCSFRLGINFESKMSLFDWLKVPTQTASHQLTAGALTKIPLGLEVTDPVLQVLDHKSQIQGSGQER